MTNTNNAQMSSPVADVLLSRADKQVLGRQISAVGDHRNDVLDLQAHSRPPASFRIGDVAPHLTFWQGQLVIENAENSVESVQSEW